MKQNNHNNETGDPAQSPVRAPAEVGADNGRRHLRGRTGAAAGAHAVVVGGWVDG
jgi:hypothetical protein